MKLTKWFGIGSFAIVASLVGCGSPAEGTENTPLANPKATGAANEAPTAKIAPKKSLKIVMIAKSTSNPVFLAARVGAEAAAKEITEKDGIKVEVDWRTPANEDGQEQAQRIAQAVNDGADAVLLACSDAGKVNGAINDAVAKGVQVMTFDSDAPDSKRFAFYGPDDIEVGTNVMKELMVQTGGKGNVGILGGNQNAPNLQKRIKGIKDEAKKYPGVKIVDTFYHLETPQDAANELLKAMKARPEIDAWALPGGWPLFTKTLLTELDPAKVKIVSVDCMPVQLPYIEKGIAPVMFAQPVYKWGYESVKIMVDKLGKGKDVPVINKMELVRVSKENLSEWAKQLKDWGFTDVDPKYLK